MSIDFTKTFVDNNIKYRIDSEDTCTVVDCIDKEQKKIEIPSVVKNFRVKAISNEVFYGCGSLTSISIPDSVTSIGYEAFSGCNNLTRVYITDIGAWCNIKFGNYSANPLYYAHNLYINGVEVTDLVVPDSVTSIGNYAFRECRSLINITIPDSVTSIGYGAFCNCSGLISITILNGVTKIGYDVFSGCRSLKKVVIPNSVTSIESYAFYNCSSLTSITIGNGVTSIGDWAFKECHSLTSITIPDSVTSIGYGAFCNCSGLISITILNGVTKIGYDVFSGCRSLKKVVIPNSVTSIGSYAFYNCSSLTSITIGNGITSIGDWAFSECKSLTSITIPDSVTSIGDRAFHGCSRLKTQFKNYKAVHLENGQLMCRDFIYKINEWTPEIDHLELCENGYHYCTNLFDIFNYYSGMLDEDIAIFECEVGDKVISDSDGTSKHCTNTIKLTKRLYREDVIKILNGEELRNKAKEGETSNEK